MSKFDSILLNHCFIEVKVFFTVRNEGSYWNCLDRSGFSQYPEALDVGCERIVVMDNDEDRHDIARLLADFTRCDIDYVTEGL